MSEVHFRVTQQVVTDLTRCLIDRGAKNYIEDHYTVTIEGSTPTTAVITVQYTDKPSPHELRVQVEQERDQLRADNERLRGIINEVHGWAVCGAIAAPDDMAQNLPRICEITAPPAVPASKEYDHARPQGKCNCVGLCAQRGLASDEASRECRLVYPPEDKL